MTIWHKPLTLEGLNQRSQKTLAEHLNIKFTDIGDDYLSATMPVDHRTIQPIGLLHGGANCVLAETVASTAANCVVDQAVAYCVGQEINANHVRAATKGIVTATSHPLHLGTRSQVWQTEIVNQANKLICVSRMTIAVINRKKA